MELNDDSVIAVAQPAPTEVHFEAVHWHPNDGIVSNAAGNPPTLDLDIFESAIKESKAPTQSGQPLKLNQLIKYSGLTLNKKAYQEIERKFPPQKYKMVTNESLLGIEIEVENIKNNVPLTHYWVFKTDGSLRNNGAEFVSMPLSPNQVEYALTHLKDVLYRNNQPDFSNRTSVHVHINARDFTQDNLFCFVVLYAIFERHFFKFAGTKRESSIFCVPVYKTNYLRKLSDFCYNLRKNWSKYCALNLVPVLGNDHTPNYGTIEFRHLYGTLDVELLIQWVNSILCLKQAALKWKKDDLLEELRRMNTVSSYAYMYKEIFGDLCINLLKHDFEFCISQVKKELFRTEYSSTLQRTDVCSYFKLFNILEGE